MKLKENGIRLAPADEQPHQVSEFELKQNISNPFNASTMIAFSIPHDCHVRLSIGSTREDFDMILLDCRLKAGRYHLHWDGKDAQGRQLQEGNYRYRLESKGYMCSRRLIIKGIRHRDQK